MAKGSPLLSSSLFAPPAPYLGSLMRSYSTTGEDGSILLCNKFWQRNFEYLLNKKNQNPYKKLKPAETLEEETIFFKELNIEFK